MPIDQAILALLMPFTLVLTRLTGLFLFTPVLVARGAPRRFRALVALTLALAVTPLALGRVDPGHAWSIYDLPRAIVLELSIGAIIGLVAAIPIAAMDMAGTIMGHQMGFGLARVYSPEFGTETESIGQLLMLLATAIYLSLGGLEACFVALTNSFSTIAPGGMSDGGGLLEVFLGAFESGVELAIRVSAPVVGIIALLLMITALLMKTIPQLNVMSVGFTVKIVAALAALTTALPAVHEAVEGQLSDSLRTSIAITGPAPARTGAANEKER
jgi:flagellar biosynthesis protein FliR